jgi:predicted DNA-binding transcriptional regulator AlpA
MRKPKPSAAFLTAPQVMERYQVSHMFLVRRIKLDPDFPKPLYIGRLRFFRIADLEEYERKCALRGRPTKKTKKQNENHAAA